MIKTKTTNGSFTIKGKATNELLTYLKNFLGNGKKRNNN